MNSNKLWNDDPFNGDWHSEGISDESGGPSDITPPPLIFRLDPSEIPDFFFPAIVPQGSSLKSCRVIDAFKAPDNGIDALLRKLGIRAANSQVEVAEALLVQAAWSIGLFFSMAKKGRRTTAKHLLQLDPALDTRVASLLTAVVNRDVYELRRVLLANADEHLENVRLPGGNTLLHFAANVPGSINVVAALLDMGADINALNDVGTGPLVSAVWADAALADLLLDRGADALSVGLEGDTGLAAAAWLGRREIAVRLLDREAFPFITDKNGGHALIWAAQAGHVEIVDLILQRFPDQIDVPTGAYGLGSDDPAFEPDQTSLPSIARFRRRRIAKSPWLGRSALVAATTAGRLKAVELLLDCGANPNLTDRLDRTALHFAAMAEAPKASIIKTLIRKGADLEAEDEDGYTPLMAAALNESLGAVSALVRKGADINAKDKSGQTALHHAAAFGRSETISSLLKFRPSPSPVDDRGFTPLHLALSFPEATGQIVKALVDGGSDPNELTKDGRTPLMLLLSSKRTPEQRIDLAKVLLSLDADPNLEGPSGRSALLQAAYEGQDDIVDVLLSAGTSIQPKGEQRATPLHAAVIRGHDVIVASLIKALLREGAQVDIKDQTGETALHEAVQHRNRNAWSMLLEAGADPWLESNSGRTPALAAALAGLAEFCDPVLDAVDLGSVKSREVELALICASALGRIDLVRRLVEAGVSVDCQSTDNWRPLSAAALQGQLAVIDILLEHGARVNWRSNVPTALSCAAENGNEEIVRKLLEAGADPNAPASHGTTPLIFATANGRLGAVRLLLDAGAFPDVRNRVGLTPLHIAANEERPEIIRALLDKKAKPNTLDDDGRSPLFLAASKGDESSIELLLDAGADPKLVDNNGRSVIEAASKKSSIDRLVDAGAPRPRVKPPESSLAEFLEWVPISKSRASRLREQFSQIALQLDDGTWKKWIDGKAESDAREAELPFYDQCVIVVVEDNDFPFPNEKFLIWSEAHSFIRLLDWTNEPFFEASEALHWRIDQGNQATAIQYLKFYFFFVRGQLGRFEIAEPGDQLNWLDDAEAEEINRVASRLKPIEMLPDPPDGTLQFRFTCVFKNAIFLTDAYLGLRTASFSNDGERVSLVAGQFSLANEKLLEENLRIRVSTPPTAFG